MSRVQLALNVSDLDGAVAFYSMLFDASPAKVRAGCADFAIADPPLKLVLFEHPDALVSINHVGVEVFAAEGVEAAGARLAEAGLDLLPEQEARCCYALQTRCGSAIRTGCHGSTTPCWLTSRLHNSVAARRRKW